MLQLSQCWRKRNQSNWIRSVQNSVSFQQMDDVRLARSPLTHPPTKQPNNRSMGIFVMFVIHVSRFHFLNICSAICLLALVSSFPSFRSYYPPLSTLVYQAKSSFHFNKTIILILQFNDLCSQCEKWIKPCTKSAILHTSYRFWVQVSVFVWYRAIFIAKQIQDVSSSWLFD